MKIYAIKIESNKRYGFTIGSRSKPDSRFKNDARTQIELAMRSIAPESPFGIAIVHDPAGEFDARDDPEIQTMAPYLVFVTLEGMGDDLSGVDIEEAENEVSEMLRGMFGDDYDTLKLGIVILRDCTVKIVTSPNPSGRLLLW